MYTSPPRPPLPPLARPFSTKVSRNRAATPLPPSPPAARMRTRSMKRALFPRPVARTVFEAPAARSTARRQSGIRPLRRARTPTSGAGGRKKAKTGPCASARVSRRRAVRDDVKSAAFHKDFENRYKLQRKKKAAQPNPLPTSTAPQAPRANGTPRAICYARPASHDTPHRTVHIKLVGRRVPNRARHNAIVQQADSLVASPSLSPTLSCASAFTSACGLVSACAPSIGRKRNASTPARFQTLPNDAKPSAGCNDA